jgi:hypothetical protein
MSLTTQFDNYIEQLPGLLRHLTAAPALLRDDLDGIPARGIYVFYEGDRAIWTGRSDNLKPYLKSQGQLGGDNFTAPIAFGFAKQAAIGAGYRFPTARQAIRDSQFRPHFDREKARVAAMHIRVVEVTNPVLQNLLVIYTALALQTLNTFETH